MFALRLLHALALTVILKMQSSCCYKCNLLAAVSLAGEDKQAEVQAARTAGDMWKAIGKDSWVVVPIASTSRPGDSILQ